MRVGIDISPLTADRTGVGTYTYELLKHLLLEAGRAGPAFSGFASGMGGLDLRELAGPASPGFEGIRRLRVPTRLLYKLWSATGRPRVDDLLGGVDVYHATNYFLPPVRRARRIATFYDLAFLRAPDLCSPKIVGPFAKGVPRFAREADAILTCSESSKRDIAELCGVAPEKVTVAYGAVGEDVRPVPRDEAAALVKREYGIDGPYVLFVSTIEPRKNVGGLIRAFAEVAKEFPHTLVLAGGAGWNVDGVEGMAETLGLGDRVRFTGYVREGRHLPALYSAADVFVLPSFYEGFGLPVLEAMTCGCPVITANNSSLPEVGGDAAVYVEAGEVDDIARALCEVLGDEAKRRSMAERGVAQARRFSWASSARTVLDLYGRLG